MSAGAPENGRGVRPINLGGVDIQTRNQSPIARPLVVHRNPKVCFSHDLFGCQVVSMPGQNVDCIPTRAVRFAIEE